MYMISICQDYWAELISMNSVPAGRTIWWRARWAARTARGTGSAGITRTKRWIFPATKVGHHFTGFFGFTFRTYRICFFIHAYGDNFKLFSTLIAFIFIYRHNFISLMFFFQSKDKEGKCQYLW